MAAVKFKIDENLPEDVASLLREEGYDAVTVAAQELSGSNDATVAAACQREQRTLVTLDVGFADIRSYPPNEFSGLVVLRLKRQDRAHVLDVLRRLAGLFAREVVVGTLWIADEERVRIRR